MRGRRSTGGGGGTTLGRADATGGHLRQSLLFSRSCRSISGDTVLSWARTRPPPARAPDVGGNDLGAGDGNRTRMTSLEGWDSAIELRPRKTRQYRGPVGGLVGESGRGDLNPRPPAPKAGALPGCATPRMHRAVTPIIGDRARTFLHHRTR